jgi:biopolymer transport protein ExbD
VALKIPKGKPPNGDINVTPLIDVVLVLLIIFMVITPIIINEMAVNLPDKTQTVEQDDVPQDQLVAAVCEDGTVALNTVVMPLPQLEEDVRKRLRSKAQKVVFVDAHPDAPYEQVVILMDTVRQAGAEKLGVGSLKLPEDFRACSPAAAPETAPGADGAAVAPSPGG